MPKLIILQNRVLSHLAKNHRINMYYSYASFGGDSHLNLIKNCLVKVHLAQTMFWEHSGSLSFGIKTFGQEAFGPKQYLVFRKSELTFGQTLFG
jgi:hypothetical protein